MISKPVTVVNRQQHYKLVLHKEWDNIIHENQQIDPIYLAIHGLISFVVAQFFFCSLQEL